MTDITSHAIKRYIARSGDTEKVTEKLLDMLRRSKPSTEKHARPGREIRVFGDWVLIVSGDSLITVFLKHHRSRIKAIRK